MIQVMKNLNLLQKSGMVQTVKKQKVNITKTAITFETENIKSSPCDYSDAFILVTGDVTVAANNNTDVAFENCAPFCTWKAGINDVFTDEANHIYIAMPMYNLIEYSDNYLDTSGSLWQFKRDEFPAKIADLSIDNSKLFIYEANLAGKTVNEDKNTNSSVKKIIK